MMTHRAIAARFKAGQSVEEIAWSLRHYFQHGMSDAKKWIEHALRQAMRRQQEDGHEKKVSR